MALLHIRYQDKRCLCDALSHEKHGCRSNKIHFIGRGVLIDDSREKKSLVHYGSIHLKFYLLYEKFDPWRYLQDYVPGIG